MQVEQTGVGDWNTKAQMFRYESPWLLLELRGRSDLDELAVQHEPLGVGAAPPLVLLP